MFKYFLYKVGQFIVNKLPLNAAYSFAGAISFMQYLLSPRDRRAVRNNLKAILGSDQNIEKITRNVFINFGKYLVEFFRIADTVDLKYIKENVKVENLQILDKVLKDGRGGIFVSAHIGNYELGAVFLSVLGYSFVAVALPHKERPVNDLFNSKRQSRGITVVPIHLAIRRGYETLRENKFFGLIADRDFSLSGEVLDFLGRRALMPKGPAMFSLKTGAPIIPIFLFREKDGKFRLNVNNPIYPPKSNDNGNTEKDSMIGIMKEYTAIIEEKIRQYPDQWFMFREFEIK